MTKRPKGFFKGAEAEAREEGKAMSPGTSASGGGRGGSPGTGTGATHIPTQPKKKAITTGDGKKRSILDFSPTYQVGKALYKGVKSIFQPKTEQQKVEANIKKGYDVLNPAEMHRAETKKTYDWGPTGGDGQNVNVTTPTQSLVTAPTADKAAGFGHQWNFQAYPGTPGTTYNPKAYAKKGKLIRKYATGQEIKNFSKGKRFGPPPLKGPDPQGLQVILENSDYFNKLIG